MARRNVTRATSRSARDPYEPVKALAPFAIRAFKDMAVAAHKTGFNQRSHVRHGFLDCRAWRSAGKAIQLVSISKWPRVIVARPCPTRLLALFTTARPRISTPRCRREGTRPTIAPSITGKPSHSSLPRRINNAFPSNACTTLSDVNTRSQPRARSPRTMRSRDRFPAPTTASRIRRSGARKRSRAEAADVFRDTLFANSGRENRSDAGTTGPHVGRGEFHLCGEADTLTWGCAIA